jgi:Protein of unknown function (DUF2905)
MNDAGKMLMLAGLGLFVIGFVFWSGFGRGWFGRLPGDVHYQRGNFSFYFPVVTCILLSIVLSVLFRLFRK